MDTDFRAKCNYELLLKLYCPSLYVYNIIIYTHGNLWFVFVYFSRVAFWNCCVYYYIQTFRFRIRIIRIVLYFRQYGRASTIATDSFAKYTYGNFLKNCQYINIRKSVQYDNIWHFQYITNVYFAFDINCFNAKIIITISENMII